MARTVGFLVVEAANFLHSAQILVNIVDGTGGAEGHVAAEVHVLQTRKQSVHPALGLLLFGLFILLDLIQLLLFGIGRGVGFELLCHPNICLTERGLQRRRMSVSRCGERELGSTEMIDKCRLEL